MLLNLHFETYLFRIKVKSTPSNENIWPHHFPSKQSLSFFILFYVAAKQCIQYKSTFFLNNLELF